MYWWGGGGGGGGVGCERVMEVLRVKKDSVMAVLEAFGGVGGDVW